MICMKYDHNKKFGLLKFHSGYGQFNLNSPKGYSLKIINAQTASTRIIFCVNNIFVSLSFSHGVSLSYFKLQNQSLLYNSVCCF